VGDPPQLAGQGPVCDQNTTITALSQLLGERACCCHVPGCAGPLALVWWGELDGALITLAAKAAAAAIRDDFAAADGEPGAVWAVASLEDSGTRLLHSLGQLEAGDRTVLGQHATSWRPFAARQTRNLTAAISPHRASPARAG